MLIFRQLFDPQSSTYSYLVADRRSKAAVLIDPVFEQARRDAALIHELDLKLVATLDTHVHADHVTGAWLLKALWWRRCVVRIVSGSINFISHFARRLLKFLDSLAKAFREFGQFARAEKNEDWTNRICFLD